MPDPKEVPNESGQPEQPKAPENIELEVRGLGSVALARLVEEVQTHGAGDLPTPTAYNRTYNRHNR